MAAKLIQTAQPESKSNHHLGSVDQLRGVAILVVLFDHLFGINFHWVLPWVNGVRDFTAYGYQSVFVHFFYLGWAGVSLFFVLSGFCIHWSCLRWERFEIGRFFWLRFWRIYPAYLIAVIIFSAWEFRGNYDPAVAWQFWSHIFLVHNFSDSTLWGINTPFWSIAIEAQLYLLYPILLLIKKRAGWRGCFLAAGALSIIWRVITLWIWGLPENAVSPAMASPFNTWIDWMLGAWIAECYRDGRRAFPSSRVLPFVTLFCFLVTTIYRPLTLFSFFLASLTSALWLDQMLNRKAPGIARSEDLSFHLGKGIAWFGVISYSLYLWHQPILVHWHDFVEKFLGSRLNHPVCVLLSVGGAALGATVIAYFLYHFLEKPCIQLGRLLLGRLTAFESNRRRIAPPPLGARNESIVTESQ
jgi:peptidoglycan/LPS O-acetylase OafA/YrhL